MVAAYVTNHTEPIACRVGDKPTSYPSRGDSKRKI